MDKVAKSMRDTVWEKGFTNMAQAFSTAETIMMNGGRSDKPSTVVVITDGKPTFKFETFNKVKEFKDKGIKVVMVVINDRLGKKERAFMKKLASGPDDENVVMIPGVKKLKADMDTYVTKALVHSCSRSESPSAMGEYVDTVGFIKKRENEWCGDEGMEPGSKTCTGGAAGVGNHEKGCLHMFLGIAETASECYGWAIMNEAKYFAWNSGGGTTPNRGHCHAELTEDGDKCPEGWTERENVDFYKITNFGEGPSMDDDDMGPAGF